MTALCGGGTSAPKAGFPQVVDYAVSLIAELLAFRGTKAIIPVLPLINTGALSLSTFCASDPPAMPTLTSAEADAVLQLRFGADFDSGIAKFRDVILHTIWYDACECTSGTATPFVPPTLPTDMPTYQPPVPAPVEPCYEDAITTFTRSAGGGPTFTGFVTHAAAYALPISLGVLTIEVIASTGNFNVTIEVRQQTIDASATGHTYSFVRGVGVSTVNVTYDPLYPVWAIYMTGAAGTGSRDVNVSAKMYCGQAPGGTVQPCCPPDEATQASLDLILRMVTLVQRQIAPFAYVYGDNHSGLSGNGELTPVSGLIGVSVDVGTLPTNYGVSAGMPEHLFDVGYVTLGTADGWLKGRRIDADGTLELAPNGVGALTRIGYTLAPGVTASIRELIREP